MQTTEKQSALMGQLVTVGKIYQRGLSKGGVRQWVEVERAGAAGWIVGFRTIWDGYVDWDTGEYGQKESGNYFVPTGHRECVLVAFSPRQKPVNVPLDGFTIATIAKGEA